MKLQPRVDENGDPVLQYATIEDFRLTSGDTLRAARLGFCVLGQGDDHPVVIVHPALTGSPKIAVNGKGSQGEGWWSQCVGPQKFLDTDKYMIICVDHLGGNGHSTSADEITAELGERAQNLCFQDAIELTAAVLERCGIRSLHAVIGGSIGGGQALGWLANEKISVERLFDISGNSYHNGPAQEFFRIQADLLHGEGRNIDELKKRLRVNNEDLLGKTPAFDTIFQLTIDNLERLAQSFDREAALKIARQIGFFRFVTPRFFQKIWDRSYEESGDQGFADAQTRSWLEHQGEIFPKRFSPTALAALCRMEAEATPYDAATVAARLQQKNCRLIGFSVSGDVLFEADRQFSFYQAVRENLPEEKRELVDIHFAYDEVNGHDHFLHRDFLDQVPNLSKHLSGAKKEEGFETRAIHKGNHFRENTGAIIPPIYMTSTFESGNEAGFDYTRSGNPNFINLENTLSSLENAKHATVFASGVSAITAVASCLKSGDLVIAEEVIYGCTYRLFDKVFDKFGVNIEYVDFSNPENFSVILDKRPALVWIESPTNPLLKIIDVRAISKYTARSGSILVVDNTFASSFFQKPLDLGADISLSSTTKYVNGHSDCLGGVVCTNSAIWHDKMVFAQKALGLNPSPLDTWLILRGLKTLALRMEQHQKNALRLATYLESLPQVKMVRYPLLPTHPQYQLAKRQMDGGSGIVTAEFNLPYETIKVFVKALRMFTLAESLGGIESLVCHPATMSHASVPEEQRLRLGITESLLRFSVGVEHSDDLINDIDQALHKVTKKF